VNIDPKILAIIVVAIVVVVGAAILLASRRKAALRERFGPEYERSVRERGSERAAQAALAEREKRVEKFHIRELDATERERFDERWHSVQSRFVDDPRGAVLEADDNVQLLMATRGYPMSDFDQRAADLSVDHPQVVDNYRLAHSISLRHRRGEANTEDLRQAMIHYRSLFDELLHGRKPSDRKVA
jgi:hypothetical protein